MNKKQEIIDNTKLTLPTMKVILLALMVSAVSAASPKVKLQVFEEAL